MATDPNAELAELEELFDEIASVTLPAAREAAEEGIAATKQITTEIVAGIAKGTEAAQVIQLQAGTAALEVQNDVRKASGGSAGRQLLLDSMAELRLETERVSELNDQKRKRLNKLPGPLAAIFGNIATADLDVRLAQAEAERRSTVAEIAGIASSTESVASTVQLTKEAVTDGTIKANTDLIAADALIKKGEAELRGNDTNAAAMDRLYKMDERQIDNKMKLLEFESQEENRKVRREAHQIQRETNKIQLANLSTDTERQEVALAIQKEQLEAITDLKRKAAAATKIEADQAALDRAQAQRTTKVEQIMRGQSAVLGETKVEPRATIERAIDSTRSTPEERERASIFALIGIPKDVDDMIFGTTEAEVSNTLDFLAPLGTTLNRFTTRFEEAKADQRAQDTIDIEAGKDISKNLIVRTQQLQNFITNRNKIDEVEIIPLDNTNIYSVSASWKVIAELPAVSATALFQEVLNLEPPMQELNEQTIWDLMNAAIQVSPDKANLYADNLKAIFDAAVLHRETLHGGSRRYGYKTIATHNVRIRRDVTPIEFLATVVGEALTEGARIGTILLEPVTAAIGLFGGPGELPVVVGPEKERFFIIDFRDSARISAGIAITLRQLPPITTERKIAQPDLNFTGK